MKIKAITLDDDSNPETITVLLSRDEAVAIATVFGRMNVYTEREFGLDPSVCSEIYGALTGDVFNRFYEEGLAKFGRNTKCLVPSDEVYNPTKPT